MTVLHLPPRRTPPAVHPLHRAILATGVTVTDAAQALGVSRAWLSDVLHGKRRPGPDLAARMGDLERALREEITVGVGNERA